MYMIDEGKNLVSDKLWEFFATPWDTSAPELSTLGNVEVGTIFTAIHDFNVSGPDIPYYNWISIPNNENIHTSYMFKLANRSRTSSNITVQSSDYNICYQNCTSLQISPFTIGNTNERSIRIYAPLKGVAPSGDSIAVYYYDEVCIVGIRLH